MKSANVSYAKAHLSALLARVKAGETVTITDRQEPIAVLGPLPRPLPGDENWLRKLQRQGLLRPPTRPPPALSRRALPRATPGASAVSALLAERGEGW